MPSGVYIKTKEHIKKLSEANKGILPWITGRHHSEESKRKISRASKGITKEMNPNLVKSEETKRKISSNNKTKLLWQNPKYRKKMCKAHQGRHVSKNTKKKIRKSAKKNWQNPDFAEKQLKAMLNGNKASPNQPEKKLKRRLKKLFPNKYKFVGDGTLWIGNRNPDFININNQKKIIELFGNYWHSKKITGKTKTQEENQRIRYFAKYGYQTLIVWQRELKDIPKLKRKLRLFNKNE